MSELRALPSPALPFVGREREVAALRRLLAAAPVVALLGPRGIGKTAVALQALADVDAARFVALADAALPIDAASLLQQAEARGATVVLDGYEASHAERTSVLEALARGARDSRWVITTRALGPGPPPRLTLAPLSDTHSRALATALGVAEADIAWVVAAAHGAPRRLRRGAAGSPAPTFDVPDTWRPWLRQLAELPAPAPIDGLTGATEDAVAAAVADGLVLLSPAGPTLDPVVRADLKDLLGALTDDEKRELADVLQANAGDAARANAIALRLRLGDVEHARALLDAHGADLLDSDQVRELWEQLRPASAPQLRRWRFRVAVAAGAVGEVDADEIADDDDEIACDRARLLVLRGRNDEAREAALAVLAAPSDARSAQASFRASMLAAAASLNLREPDRALETLANAAPSTERERVGYAILQARALAVTGREVAGRAVLDDVRPLALRLGTGPRSVTLARLAATCLDVDDRALARHLLPDPVADAHAAFGADVTHTVDLVHACIVALADGRLADVQPFAELQRTLPIEDHLVATAMRLIRAEWLIATGQLGEARDVLALIAGKTARYDEVEWAALLATQIAMARGERPADDAPSAHADDVARIHVIAALRHALRWGAGPFDTLPSRTRLKAATRRCLPLQLRAEHHLLHGAIADAVYDAGRACREAETHGYGVHLADALLTQADIACVAQRWADLARGADKIVAQGQQIASPRVTAEARLFGAALAGDWPALDRLADALEPAPVAARRAAALFGDEVALDAIDRLVVTSLTAREGAPTVRTRGASGPAWGVDLTRARAWSRGAWVPLEVRTNAWKTLAALATAGGHATSAELLRDVWGIERYAPHLHDNRLQITMHRLRQALGGDDDAPRIVRDGEGYAFAGRCRIVQAS